MKKCVALRTFGTYTPSSSISAIKGQILELTQADYTRLKKQGLVKALPKVRRAKTRGDKL